MAHSIWTDLCSQPTHPVSTEKYATIVYDSTIRLHQPIHSMLTTLDRRAMALTKLANFESALRNANVMQQLSPSSPLGYLRAATIYSEQGKQRHVIDVCNKGLMMVDRDDMHYGVLQKARADAEQREDNRIDFVSQLPLDIVFTTLIPMFMDDDFMSAARPSPYLFASHAWRDRIVECFGGLRFIFGNDEGLRHEECLQVIEFAQHTKELLVQSHSEGTWFCELLSENDFCILRKLYIGDLIHTHGDRIVSCLESISNTLTDLNISLEGTTLRVPTIVEACPNLVLLCINDTPDVDVSSLSMATSPTLTTLALTFSHTGITCDQIVEIWKRFQSLKRLELHPCTDIQSALIVLQHAPWISNIDLVMCDDDGIELTFSCEEHPSERIGIKNLTISSETEKACTNTTSIVKQHHNTLEKIEWVMDTSCDTDTIDDRQYPHLKKLHIYISGWELPRNAPLLEDLIMTSQTIKRHPATLDTIPPNLKKLTLDLKAGLDAASKSSIEHYLDRLAQHQLKYLTIALDSKDNVDNLLHAIHRHNQLEHLKVTLKGVWNSYSMEQFVHGLVNGCPRLISLELVCHAAPSANTMNSLKHLEHLQQLALLIKGTEDYDNFWNVIPTIRQIKCLVIQDLGPGRDAKVKYLKQQRPDMQITVEGYYSQLFKPLASAFC
ncbi:hypothetical protein O0I10_006245 [Lichtheimia ornata]|uniref:Uncharacterized protein n=1 Tax=Lichtheimia ornata TaxID=688661 RepID=A0AAD7V369_9FUNG|nr:uncharacterized protein O0I10_006245 [Lichtheimia ornata]KAJ8657974.1 hypothetical protein O0I10_006245 [Lichtheimia ornata]